MKRDITDDSDSKPEGQVYLFYGDEFLVKEQVQKLTSEVLDPELRSTNLVVLDGNNLHLATLASHLFTPSLFGGHRVVLVDQTPIFMGKVDRRKVVEKVLASWKNNDRKAAFRAFGQLLSLMGLAASDISGRSDWIHDIEGDSLRPEQTDTLLRVAGSFVESGERAESRADETQLEELLVSPFAEQTVLVLTAPAVDKRKRIFKLVEQRGRVMECTIREERFGTGLDKSFFDDRVRETLALAGKKISSSALEKMYSRSGKDIRRLQSELEKLIGYLGDRKEVTPGDVESLFADFHEAAFYDLTTALGTGDLGTCLTALHENMKIVAHPLQTLTTIANYFRRLMVAREMLFTVFRSHWKAGMSYQSFVPLVKKVRSDSVQATDKGKFNLLTMKDYPLYRSLKDAQKFPMERLVRIMEAILEADILMKSTRLGGAAPGSILENLMMEICRPTEGERTPRASRPTQAWKD